MVVDSQLARIAIVLIPGVGDVTIRKLVAYCGSIEAVFAEKKSALVKIPGISNAIASSIIQSASNKDIWLRAEEELCFCERYNIKILSFTDEAYPYRLKHCDDAPATIFVMGNIDLNPRYTLSIVGTRRATQYGKSFCETLLKDFSEKGIYVTIISGFAFGIDITAHRFAMDFELPTIAVVAHGLDTIYPPEHKKYVKKMLANGALLTEFLTKTGPDKPNFVKRNRIIASLSDATLVVESRKDGGAMITADFAFGYNRDVFALPGRIHDIFSEGPNYLIKTNKASLVESAEDICSLLGWKPTKNENKETLPIVFNFSEEEKLILTILKENGDTPIDLIALKANMPVSKVSSTLLNLEFNSVVKCLPGKIYTLNIKI